MEGKRCDEYPYHGGFVVPDSVHGEPMLYDMSATLRAIPWSHYNDRKSYLFDLPVDVPEDFLAAYVGRINYGTLDVLTHPLMQSLGWNLPGVHCTEFTNDVMWWHGMRTPWFPLNAPPSPCAQLRWAMMHLNESGPL